MPKKKVNPKDAPKPKAKKKRAVAKQKEEPIVVKRTRAKSVKVEIEQISEPSQLIETAPDVVLIQPETLATETDVPVVNNSNPTSDRVVPD